nr:unnamed protein product [Leishmania braziliensis]
MLSVCISSACRRVAVISFCSAAARASSSLFSASVARSSRSCTWLCSRSRSSACRSAARFCASDSSSVSFSFSSDTYAGSPPAIAFRMSAICSSSSRIRRARGSSFTCATFTMSRARDAYRSVLSVSS